MTPQEQRNVVLASRNPDKIRELKQLCEGLPLRILSADDFPGLPDVIEDGTTMLGNAARKAIITAAYTGEISVADDTALQVTVLNGMPDIFAARFSGPGATYASNAELLLELMRDVPDDHRQARFATACAWVDPRPGESSGGEPTNEAFPVTGAAHRRWLRNPWARSITLRDTSREDAFWNELIDREAVWADYGARITDVQADHGQDAGKLASITRALLATHGEGEGLRIPDPRIWAVTSPQTDAPAPTRVAPSGLDPEAPGRAVNEAFWLEIAAEGRLLGRINRQPVGAGGFGYDPVFVPMGGVQTLAEIESEEKNAISHRGVAFRRLVKAARRAYGV